VDYSRLRTCRRTFPDRPRENNLSPLGRRKFIKLVRVSLAAIAESACSSKEFNLGVVTVWRSQVKIANY
jgi:hypothetical protein